MKIEAALTISKVTCPHGDNYITIRIKDAKSLIEFVELEIKLQDFAEAITGLGYVPCSAEVHNLENVGKTYEHDQIEFPLTKINSGKERLKEALKDAEKHCPEGWTCSSYFGSQRSFFYRESKPWAQCSIYRWVDK